MCSIHTILPKMFLGEMKTFDFIQRKKQSFNFIYQFVLLYMYSRCLLAVQVCVPILLHFTIISFDLHSNSISLHLMSTLVLHPWKRETHLFIHLNINISASPIEEVTDALSGKGVQFMMTHDIELHMPSILFDSSVLRISPRSFEGNGALVKIELMPNEARGVKATGRIFFKKISMSCRQLNYFYLENNISILNCRKILQKQAFTVIFGYRFSDKINQNKSSMDFTVDCWCDDC